MPLSVFDLFTVGIGPSSSHTVGPMRAGSSFIHLLGDALGSVADLHVDVFGSLAATGAGHGTFDAILIGLEGCRPDLIEANELTARRTRMSETGTIILGDSTGNGVEIALTEDDMVKRPLTVLPRHTNALTITAFDSTGQTLAEETYYSVGGGFVTSETEFLEKEKSAEAGAEDGPESSEFAVADSVVEAELESYSEELPYPFHSGAELLERCRENDMSIAEIMHANELSMWDEDEIRHGLLHIYSVMEECASASLDRSGYLPGGLKVRRRAHDWYLKLKAEDPDRDLLPGVGQSHRHGRQRGERFGRTRRHRADERGSRDHPGRAALRAQLRAVCGRRRRSREAPSHHRLPAHCGGDRRPLQGTRVDLRCRGRLPG